MAIRLSIGKVEPSAAGLGIKVDSWCSCC